MDALFSAQELYTGHGWLSEVVVEITNSKITAIKKDGYDHVKAYPLVVPALIDLQIYGAAGKLLSAFPEQDTIEKIYEYCLAGGAAYFQPTVATHTTGTIYAAIDAVKGYQQNGGKGCIGLHIEGPWINKAKKGAHKESIIHAPSEKEVLDLLAYGKGYISMITLAPEVCDPALIKIIQNNGVVVSAGHTAADYATATNYFNNGITVATHLYNAMSSLQHRAPGVVGALFNHKKAKCSLVADGYHVDFSAIQIAKKIMGERLFCITDAVTPTQTDFYQHELVGDKFESGGILSGSALTQIKSINNLVEYVGLDLGEAVNMCSLYPAQVMQIKDITGTIAINENADLLCLSADRQLLKMYVA